LTTGTVAPGRTIWAPPDPETSGAWSPFTFQAPPTIYNPGDTITTLSDADYARCLACGAIVDPNFQIVPIGDTGAWQLIPG
jgi:hypothetical protein